MSGRATSEQVRAVREGAGVAEVEAPVVVLAGPDARRFANGMFTQDVRSMTPGDGRRSGWADDRGRLLGLMDVYCAPTAPGFAGDAFVLVLEGTDAEAFLGRFEKFVMFDDVEMEAVKTRLVTVQGPRAEAVVRAAGLEVPEAGYRGTAEARGVGRRDRTGLGGLDLLLPPDDPGAVERLVAAGAVPVDEAVLDVLRVEAGLPRFPVDAPDKAFAHELGLRDVVLDFRKGCYVGQEIINRMDTRGKVRRGLVRLSFDVLPEPGASLTADGKEVGRVTSPLVSPDLGPVGLAVVRKPWDEPGTVLALAGGRATVR